MAQFKDNYKDSVVNNKEAAGLSHPTASQGISGKQLEDSAMRPSDFEWSEMAVNKNNGNITKGHAQPLAWPENPVGAVSREEAAVNVGTPEQGDILIDINDRFPRDFLSDIFSKAAGLNHPIASQGTSGKQLEDSAMRPSDFEWSEMATNKNNENSTKGYAQPLAWAENPVGAVSPEEAAVNVGTLEQGDILIDINDRFPRDFLSDIFSKARISPNLSGFIPLHGDGAGLSVNMENHEPKHWLYFRNLAQGEFGRKDVSLMDQDHLGFSSPLSNTEEGAPVDYSYPPLKSDGVALAHIDSPINFDENPVGAVSPEEAAVNVGASEQGEILIDINDRFPRDFLSDIFSKARISENLSGFIPLHDDGPHAPHVDLPLKDFDISALQACTGGSSSNSAP